MPVCVECGNNVATPTQQKGGQTILTRCGNCHCITDRFCEHEFIIIWLDVVLHRVQAFRHLLFNRYTQRQKQRLVPTTHSRPNPQP